MAAVKGNCSLCQQTLLEAEIVLWKIFYLLHPQLMTYSYTERLSSQTAIQVNKLNCIALFLLQYS